MEERNPNAVAGESLASLDRELTSLVETVQADQAYARELPVGRIRTHVKICLAQQALLEAMWPRKEACWNLLGDLALLIQSDRIGTNERSQVLRKLRVEREAL